MVELSVRARTPRWIPTLAVALVVTACSGQGARIVPSVETTPRTVAPSGPSTSPAAGAPSDHPNPTIGPNDPWIAFQAFGPGGRYGVQLIRPDGTDPHLALSRAPGGDEEHPDWSHDGARLVFSVKVGDREELWVADVGGANARRVVTCAEDCVWVDEAAWSPDDASIAFQRMIVHGGRAQSSLEIFDVRSMTVHVVLQAAARHVILAPRWSPDGRRLAIEYLEVADETIDGAITGDTISIVDTAANAPRLVNLLPGTRLANNPDWSPIGDLLAFSAPAAGGEPGGDRSDLWTMKPDGSDLKRVTDVATSGGYAIQPTFAPDGTRIIFVLGETAGGPGRMATVALDDLDVRPATSAGYVDGVHPRIRPAP